MEKENRPRIVYHTRLRPDAVPEPEEREHVSKGSGARRIKRVGAGSKRVRWASIPHPGAAARRRSRPNMGERLLRNSAIACAVLLCILTLGNIDQPWANRSVEAVRQALTMRVSLDESFGGMQFVKSLVPESALVFFHLSESAELLKPVSGTSNHPWSASQPWLLFSCGENERVLAAKDGTVSAVSPLAGGGYGVLIDHGDGLESVYAYLAQVSAAVGDAVTRGQVIGTCSTERGSLYYELRQGGESVDPTERMTP